MKLVTVQDVNVRQGFTVPEGSVIQQVRENKHTYTGLWCSYAGSYRVTVPKDACRSLNEMA